MAAMGGFMFIMPLFWLLTPSQEPVSPPPVTSIGHSPDWLSFAVGLVTFFGGLYIALSPNALVRWARKSMPHRILPEEIPGKGIFWAWIIGGLFMLSSITAFRAWLKSL